MSDAPAEFNPYTSPPQVELVTRPLQIHERMPLVDIGEGVFYGFAMSPVVALVVSFMLFVQTQSDGYHEFIDYPHHTRHVSPSAWEVISGLTSGCIGTSVVACTFLGTFAGILIAMQPRLSQRGLLWQMAVPTIVVASVIVEYLKLMNLWPFPGTSLSAEVHMLLAISPAAVFLLAGLSALAGYKLTGRVQFVDPEAAVQGCEAELLLAAWVRRKWRVTTPEGEFIIDYFPMEFFWEKVYVNGQLAAKTWSLATILVPRFDFSVGNRQATIEVRCWPWLTTLRWISLKVSGQVVYGEGTPV